MLWWPGKFWHKWHCAEISTQQIHWCIWCNWWIFSVGAYCKCYSKRLVSSAIDACYSYYTGRSVSGIGSTAARDKLTADVFSEAAVCCQKPGDLTKLKWIFHSQRVVLGSCSFCGVDQDKEMGIIAIRDLRCEIEMRVTAFSNFIMCSSLELSALSYKQNKFGTPPQHVWGCFWHFMHLR